MYDDYWVEGRNALFGATFPSTRFCFRAGKENYATVSLARSTFPCAPTRSTGLESLLAVAQLFVHWNSPVNPNRETPLYDPFLRSSYDVTISLANPESGTGTARPSAVFIPAVVVKKIIMHSGKMCNEPSTTCRQCPARCYFSELVCHVKDY